MTLCSHCGKPHDRTGQRYCLACHAAYQRAWRAKRMFRVKQNETAAIRALVRKHIGEAA